MPAAQIDSLPLPTLLREIPDPPKRLYVRGHFPDEGQKFLAVVGSRMHSPYGAHVCERLIRGLAGYPVVIVSGLALGIDGLAHKNALDAGLVTVAVPGSGLDERVLYPALHRELARRIIEQGGALVSEFDPLWKPRPESFPQRNRIMAGLSHAVLVVEAEERSGTLITSRLAAEYNRDVFAVPGPITSPTSKGPHLLLKRGAALITDSADIVEALALEQVTRTNNATPRCDLSEREQAVVALLAKGPCTRDELMLHIGGSASDVNMLLASLEIKGVLEERLGKVWVV